MSEKEHPDDGDAALLAALERDSRTTSERHDAAVLAAAKAAAAERGRERRRARFKRWRIAASLAAVALVAVGLVRLVPGPGPDEPPLRGERAAVSPRDGAELGAPPEAFEWPAQTGATGYRLVLLDARANPVWKSDPAPENTVALPSDIAGRLEDGGTWLWLVEIRYDGRTRELGPFSFDLAADR